MNKSFSFLGRENMEEKEEYLTFKNNFKIFFHFTFSIILISDFSDLSHFPLTKH